MVEDGAGTSFHPEPEPRRLLAQIAPTRARLPSSELAHDACTACSV